MELTDTALIEKWKTTHDPDAFTELVTRHSAMVYRAACRILRDTGHAEEVTQECFILLAQKPAMVRRSPAGWLHALAVSRALNRLRAERRRLVRESRYADQTTTICTPQWDDVQGYVDEAVASLPETLRETVVYRYLEGHSLDETAQHLSLSRSTIQTRLEKAVGEIRRVLKRRGVVVPAGTVIATLGIGSAEAVPATLTLALGKLALAGTTGTTAISVGSGVAMTGGLFVMKKMLIVIGLVLVTAFLAKDILVKPTVPASNANPAIQVISSAPPAPIKTELPPKAATQPVQPPKEGSIRDLLTQMNKAKKNCSISGIVVDPQGRPRDGISVNAFHSKMDSTETTTGIDGRFEYADLVAGQYHLALRKAGTTTAISHEEGTVIELSPNEHRANVKLVYDRIWAISGRVVNSEGQPVTDASVACISTETGVDFFGCENCLATGGDYVKCDADGFYKIENLADNTYNLSFNAKGYRRSKLLEIKAGQDNVNVVLIQGKIVKVRVLDAVTGRPIPEYEVGLYDTLGQQNEYGFSRDPFNKSTKTVNDPEGLYSLICNKQPPYVVAVRAHGYSTESQLVHDNGSLPQEGFVFRLQKGGDLHGFVRDSSGHPIPDVQIFCGNAVFQSNEDKTIKTGDNGEFTLTGFPRQVQLVSAYHPSYSIGDIMVPEKADLSKPFEIILSQGGGLRGNVRVMGVNENVTDSMSLFLFYPQRHVDRDSRQYISLPVAGGTFEFRSLKPGKATITMSRHWKSGAFEQKQNLNIPVVIEEGNIKEINADFPFSTGVIEGIVPVNSTLFTRENKSLTLKWAGMSGDEEHYGNVAGSGAYRIEGVSPGNGTLGLYSNPDDRDSLIESVPITLSEGQTYHHDFTATSEAQQP